MATLVHSPNPLQPLDRTTTLIDRPVTVRRLVQKHKSLRRYTHVYRPGGIYGRRKVREFSRATIAIYNGKPLSRTEWKRTVVRDGDVLSFVACLNPKGGGILKIAASIALIVIAAVATWYAGGSGGVIVAEALYGAGAAATAGTTAIAIGATAIAVAALSYGVMSLFADPIPSGTGSGYSNATPASSPVYNLTAQGNYARLQQAIPEVFGRNRLFPDFVATPYIRYDDDNNQFLSHIVGLGIGEFEIDEESLKLGDTPISSYPDVEWYVIEPGALSDPAIADERWISSLDLADIELPDADEGSPWIGPYAANPASTIIGTIEIDTAAPRGLWAFNTGTGGLDPLTVTFEYEAHLIDDAGDPIGDPDVWETFDPVSYTRTSQDPQRVTTGPITLPSDGRWQVRLRRTDTKNTSVQAGHQLDWIGLRGRSIGRRRFRNMTCIALKMKAGPALNTSQARQFNLIATRKLETWDSEAGEMTTVRSATRNPCDAFAYIARTTNGGRLRDDQVALSDLYDQFADFDDNDWTFDFVYDQTIEVGEALARVSRSVVAERVTQGGQLHLVRDIPVAAPVAMFGPRNTMPNSLNLQYVMVDSTSPDALIGTYIDQTTWKPIDVTVAFEDSAQERPSRLTLYGVGNRDQARAVLWNLARADRYRRRVVGWTTAMEGLAVTFGDGISFSHDVPNYGQTLEVIDVDSSDPMAPLFTLNDLPDFSDSGATYYAAVRNSAGRLAGPFVATVGLVPGQLTLTVPDPDDLPEILIGGDKERTWLQLGPGQAYSRPLKVKLVTPRDEHNVDIVAFDDDPRMYDALPDEPEVPIGISTDPIIIPVHTADGPVVNLRSMANDNDYSGLAEQQITFTLAEGEEVTIIRGSWPIGAEPILELAGTVSGADGAGGLGGAGGAPNVAFSIPGDGFPGSTGGIGGTALDASTGPLTITGDGTIRGGKGGGGGGGGGAGLLIPFGDEGSTEQLIGGAGGVGNGGMGAAGSTDLGFHAGNGGNGGALGTYAGVGNAGDNGTSGDSSDPGGAGGGGGAGGKAIVGFANVDLSGFSGTVLGTTS